MWTMLIRLGGKSRRVNYTEGAYPRDQILVAKVLSFRTTRYAGFRFTAGHYARPVCQWRQSRSWVTRPIQS